MTQPLCCCEVKAAAATAMHPPPAQLGGEDPYAWQLSMQHWWLHVALYSMPPGYHARFHLTPRLRHLSCFCIAI